MKEAEKHILDALETDSFGNKLCCDHAKIKHAYERFTREYGWKIRQVGELEALTEWLQGLALNINYLNYQILEDAVSQGRLPENPTALQEQEILEDYFPFMAKVLQGLFEKEGLIK